MLEQKRITFDNLDLGDELAERHIHQVRFDNALTLRSVALKARGLDAYGPAYRVRLYRTDPTDPLALWFAEFAVQGTSDDPRTPDLLQQSRELLLTRTVWVTYQLLSANPTPDACLQVQLVAMDDA